MVSGREVKMSRGSTISRRAFLRGAAGVLAFPYVVSSSAITLRELNPDGTRAVTHT